jgi:hypothetical protein
MNRQSLEKLRLDRRLIQRRGWMSTAERERSIEQLPDIAHKATTLGAEADARGEEDGARKDEGATPGA